ncbi:hypothetical protein E8E11_000168 [Didymella keratinophila]|nr:hypothetical protein E8E11_000168 [Didymella keratinophila]
MASSNDSKIKVKNAVTSPTAPHTMELPKYYDSEPSSQPPKYSHASGKDATRLPDTGSGASAATIAAILAHPSEAHLNEKKEKDTRPGGMQVSGPTLNAQGIGIKGWMSINSPR